ncbi:hypothetical protein AKJ16_DCAP16415 [Drosera capensis]
MLQIHSEQIRDLSDPSQKKLNEYVVFHMLSPPGGELGLSLNDHLAASLHLVLEIIDSCQDIKNILCHLWSSGRSMKVNARYGMLPTDDSLTRISFPSERYKERDICVNGSDPGSDTVLFDWLKVYILLDENHLKKRGCIGLRCKASGSPLLMSSAWNLNQAVLCLRENASNCSEDGEVVESNCKSVSQEKAALHAQLRDMVVTVRRIHTAVELLMQLKEAEEAIASQVLVQFMHSSLDTWSGPVVTVTPESNGREDRSFDHPNKHLRCPIVHLHPNVAAPETNDQRSSGEHRLWGLGRFAVSQVKRKGVPSERRKVNFTG